MMLTDFRVADFRMFAVRFALLSIFMLVFWQASLYLTAVVEDRQHRVVMDAALQRAEHGLSGRVSGFVSDLMIVARNDRLRALAGGDASALTSTEADFEDFVSEKSHVTQLRYIDRGGQEVVRVERSGSITSIADRAELENKANRAYFQKTIDLDVGALYASPIGLNFDDGSPDGPWQPVFRLATPIEPAGADSRGVVIMNINATDLLNEVVRAQPSETERLQLVNSEGYWLQGAPEDKLWGFMFDRDTTLAVEAPDIWEQLSSGDRGEFVSGGTHYLFRAFHPGRVLASVSDASTIATGDENWILIAETPGVALLSNLRWYQMPSVLAGLGIAVAIAAGWTQMIVARRRSESEAQRAEEEMMRQERLASLGSLVAGVAHELNSPIGSAVTIASTLSQNAEAFARSMEEGPLKRSRLDAFVADMRTGSAMVQRNLERADSLIRHFKQVAVDQTSERHRDFLLGDLIEDVLSSIAHQLKGTRVKIEQDITVSGTMSTYPGPLAQVLINLVNNARIHAFAPGAEGVISIVARDDGEDAVEIIVSDNGQGIAPEHLGSIFNPFFTTRLGAGGSGLGLSIVLNIVENVLKGSIQADSTPGQGTSMTLHLPRSVPAADGTHKEEARHVV